ncbi:hypothetical protein P8452_02223 [Trifolium repens]|nr:hypothetical protein P8452_02223 [Trifolium repens]
MLFNGGSSLLSFRDHFLPFSYLHWDKTPSPTTNSPMTSPTRDLLGRPLPEPLLIPTLPTDLDLCHQSSKPSWIICD